MSIMDDVSEADALIAEAAAARRKHLVDRRGVTIECGRCAYFHPGEDDGPNFAVQTVAQFLAVDDATAEDLAAVMHDDRDRALALFSHTAGEASPTLRALAIAISGPGQCRRWPPHPTEGWARVQGTDYCGEFSTYPGRFI